jgi:hypothetical protein
LILNKHGFHVTLKSIEQAQAFGLDMITLPFHTSHALQPLNVTCFEPFKTTFKKEGDGAIAKKNYIEPNKINLGTYVDKALDQSFTKKTSNLDLGFVEYDF